MTIIRRDLSLRLPQQPRGVLLGRLFRPEEARTLILIPQTGTSLTHVAVHAGLQARNYALLQLELLTPRESLFADTAQNVALLAERLAFVLDFAQNDGDTEGLAIGLFSPPLVTPAAIRAAARRDQEVGAVVAAGGFIDRAGREYLDAFSAPLLVLLAVDDTGTAAATRRAFELLHGPHELRLAEPHEVVTETITWFERWLPLPAKPEPEPEPEQSGSA